MFEKAIFVADYSIQAFNWSWEKKNWLKDDLFSSSGSNPRAEKKQISFTNIDSSSNNNNIKYEMSNKETLWIEKKIDIKTTIEFLFLRILPKYTY